LQGNKSVPIDDGVIIRARGGLDQTANKEITLIRLKKEARISTKLITFYIECTLSTLVEKPTLTQTSLLPHQAIKKA
jgi:hypothetical protein